MSSLTYNPGEKSSCNQHVLIGGSACLDGFVAIIPKQNGPAGSDRGDDQNCTYPAADNGEGDTKKLGHSASFDLTQLRSTHKEQLVDTRHAPAQGIGSIQVSDRVADNRTDRIRCAREDQGQKNNGVEACDAEQDGCQAKDDHRTYQKLSLAANIIELGNDEFPLPQLRRRRPRPASHRQFLQRG